MRIRQVLVFALVALFVLTGVAHAAKTTPIITLNSYINTTAEQISSSGGTTCQSLLICNRSTTNKVFVQNASTVASTTGWVLWPDAATSTTDKHCINIEPVNLAGAVKTVDATAWYAVAATGNVKVGMTCIP